LACLGAIVAAFLLACLLNPTTAWSQPAKQNTGHSTQDRQPKQNAKSFNRSQATPDNAAKPPGESVLLKALGKEMVRSMVKLKNAGTAPLYFLCYRVYDTDEATIDASLGALDQSNRSRRRVLDVEARVGSPQVDSSHKLRSPAALDFSAFDFGRPQEIPLDDDEDAIRTSLWLATDAAFKSAQKSFIEVKANRDVKVSEEDQSDDFSSAKPEACSNKLQSLNIDLDNWNERLRKLSAIYKEYPQITESTVELNSSCVRKYIANSEGSRVQTSNLQARVITSASAISDDGMVVRLYDSADTLDPADLPDDTQLEQRIRKLANAVVALRNAHVAEPYVGPAILRSRAAGVFFHEILGHRIEGHRQKDEEEGRTFAKKINERIMPSFISVYDDPTLTKLGNKSLVGHYDFDDEAVASKRVDIVDEGVLKNFLMGRSPINKFSQSNGHCRAEPGRKPVARQGNLIVESSKTVPYEELRRMLIAEAKKQGKPYGLVFDEIAGGFTITQTFMPQSFQLLPLEVTRVYVDGRPDELLRGVNLVGTPLASLETVICAASDVDTFNGVCGAESGWVPVSASAPSLLVRTLETAREWKEQNKPPLLPPPKYDNTEQMKKLNRL
jgi:predicted Zn-dependent protease